MIYLENPLLLVVKKLQVDIYAEQDCHILWLPIKQLLALPQKSDEYQIILKNLMMILSNKNLYLTRRIDVISQRSTKEKLLNLFIPAETTSTAKTSITITTKIANNLRIIYV